MMGELKDPRPPFQTDSSLWAEALPWLVVVVTFVTNVVPFFLPVTFPIFKAVFGSSLEQMGHMQGLFYLSALAFAAGGGWVVSRLGYRKSFIATLLLIVAALIMIGSARHVAMVLVGAFCSGLGVLSLNVTMSCIISEGFGAVRQKFFFIQGLSAAAGSIVGPAVLGWWLATPHAWGESWRSAYYFTAAILGALALWPLFLRSRVWSERRSQQDVGASSVSTLFAVLKKPAIHMICLFVMLKGITESGMTSFVGMLFHNRLGLGVGQAALFLSANAVGILGGRLLLTWITSRWRFSDLAIFAVCIAGTTLAFAATIASPNYGVGLAMLTLSGFFFSGTGPALNSYTGMRFAAQVSTAYSLMSGTSYFGSAGGPYLIGFLGTHLSLETGMWILPIINLVLTVLAFEWFAKERSSKSRTLNQN